ncbi:hypothetical protein [Desulfofalx alkaliphila]|uniref:hypothetical protein n=1 Tax=Desulfofalx alkaliphila TaxID=105483 RepID=UPI000A913F4A|nr:hypothetical protein [Desulfofalx alkaliphila]
MGEKNDGSEKENKASYLAIGSGLGIVFGVAFDNIPLGLILGIVIGLAMDCKNRRE